MPHNHNKRLHLFIKSEQLTIKGFAEKIEVEYNKFNKYINGSTKNPGIDLVISILNKFPHLNSRWWLCDEGEMKKGQEIPKGAIILDKEKFDQMQAEMVNYLKSGNEALTNYNASLKEINALEKEIGHLKTKVTQLQQR